MKSLNLVNIAMVLVLVPSPNQVLQIKINSSNSLNPLKKIKTLSNFKQAKLHFHTSHELKKGFIFGEDFRFEINIKNIDDPFLTTNQRELNIKHVYKIYNIIKKEI